MRTNKYQLLLSPDISPDGVIQGGGIPAQREPEIPQAKEEDNGAPPDNTVTEDEGEPFDLSAFEAVKRESPAPAPKKEDDKVEDKTEDKVEDKPEDKKVVTPPEKKTVVTPTTQKQTTPVARDYSDIEEGDRDLFKNMSNQAFAKLKPVYLEHKRLQQEKQQLETSLAEAKKAGLPESYYENPQAYIFDKEYQTAEQSLELVNKVAAHWQEQMQLIEKGKDWQDLKWDATKNDFVLSAPLPANPENRVAVLTAYQRILGQQGHFEQKVNTIRSTFKERHQETVQGINQLADSFFPTFKDDKSEHAIIAKDVESKLPSYMRGNPVTKIVARSLATNILLTKKVNELLAKIPKEEAVKKVVSNARRQAGPTNGDMGAAHVEQVDGGDEVTMDDFLAVKRG